jgi:flagellar biosynthesis anti-sigma factor FlgM
MTIKVDGNRPAGDAEATRRTEAVKKADTAAQPARAERKSDRVEVSRDAQLLTAALRAATDAPEIRQDVVDRMRALLDSGGLGTDSTKLAESLIDSMLD